MKAVVSAAPPDPNADCAALAARQALGRALLQHSQQLLHVQEGQRGEVAFELLTAGSQLLAASDTQQARHLLGLITTLEGSAGPALLRWLQPQRKRDAARCYELWAAVAALCRREQVQTVQHKLTVACDATTDALRARLVAQQGYAALLRALAGLTHNGSTFSREHSGEVAAALQDARVSLTVLLMYSGVSMVSMPDALGEAFLVMDVTDALLQRMQQRPQAPTLLQPAQRQVAEPIASAADGMSGMGTQPDGTAGLALSSDMQHCLALCLKVLGAGAASAAAGGNSVRRSTGTFLVERLPHVRSLGSVALHDAALQALAACCTRHQLQGQYLQAEAAVLQSTANAAAASPGQATRAPAADAALLLGSVGIAAEALKIAKQAFMQRLQQSKAAAAARDEEGDTGDAVDHLTGGDAGAASEQRSTAGELTATDLAAADEFVNGLARSEPPGCRLPLLVDLLQSDDTPEAVKALCLRSLGRIIVLTQALGEEHGHLVAGALRSGSQVVQHEAVVVAQTLVDASPNTHAPLLQQLAELAVDANAAAGVQESAALAVARLSLLNKYKVMDVIAALCRCLLASSPQVPQIGRLALQQLLHDNSKQRPALLFAMLDAVPAECRIRMAQVVRDEFMNDAEARSDALFAQCLQAVLHTTDATSAHSAATLLSCMIPPVSALKPMQLALQGEETAFLEDSEVRAALQRCTAAAEPSAGARAKADAVLKAVLLTQLQPHGRPTKARKRQVDSNAADGTDVEAMHAEMAARQQALAALRGDVQHS